MTSSAQALGLTTSKPKRGIHSMSGCRCKSAWAANFIGKPPVERRVLLVREHEHQERSCRFAEMINKPRGLPEGLAQAACPDESPGAALVARFRTRRQGSSCEGGAPRWIAQTACKVSLRIERSQASSRPRNVRHLGESAWFARFLTLRKCVAGTLRVC